MVAAYGSIASLGAAVRPTVGGFSLWAFFAALLAGSAMVQTMNCLVLYLAWDSSAAASAALYHARGGASDKAASPTPAPDAAPLPMGQQLSSDFVLVSTTIALQFVQAALLAAALATMWRNARRASLPSAWALYTIAILAWGGQYLAAEIIGGEDALILTNVAVHRRAEVETAAELWLRLTLYTSISIQTLCGLGDVVPSSVWCRVLSGAQMLFGVAANAGFVLVVHRWFARAAAQGNGSGALRRGGGSFAALRPTSAAEDDDDDAAAAANPFARERYDSTEDAATRTAFTKQRAAGAGGDERSPSARIATEAEWPCLDCAACDAAWCDNGLCFCSAAPLCECIAAARRALQRVLLATSLLAFGCTVLTLWWTHGKPSHGAAIVAVAALQAVQLASVLFSAWQYVFDPARLSVLFLAQAFLALCLNFAGMYRLLWLCAEAGGAEVVGGAHGLHAAAALPLPPFHIPDRRDAVHAFDYAASGGRGADGARAAARSVRPGGRGEFLGMDGAPLPFAAVLADLLYLSVEVMTGAGFGDVLPLATLSRVLVSAQMLVSVFFSVLLAARSLPEGIAGAAAERGSSGARRRASSPVRTRPLDDGEAIL